MLNYRSITAKAAGCLKRFFDATNWGASISDSYCFYLERLYAERNLDE